MICFLPTEIKELKQFNMQLTEKINALNKTYFKYIKKSQPINIPQKEKLDKNEVKEFVLSFSDDICSLLN
jgi:hypothetical protein